MTAALARVDDAAAMIIQCQGRIARCEDAAALAESELRSLLTALGRSRAVANLLTALPGSTVTNERGHALTQLCGRYLRLMSRFHLAGDSLEAVTRALGHLIARERILASPLDNDEMLFADYLRGACIAEILSTSTSRVATSLECEVPARDAPRESNYVGHFHATFRRHRRSLALLGATARAHGANVVWKAILEDYTLLSTSHRQALDQVVSLRGGETGAAWRMTLSQIAHWEGWGGGGELFDRLIAAGHRVPWSTYRRHRSLAIGWHSGARGGHFSPIHVFFREAAQGIATHSARVTAILLRDPILSGGNRKLAIWGDAVGPEAAAELRIVEAVRALDRSAHTPVTVVATEVSGPSVVQLLQTIEKRTGTWHVRFRDLNLPFPGEPGTRISRFKPNRFDAYSCSVALHQIADREVGHDRIRSILAFATRLVRPGGILSLPDVGKGAVLQAYLIPLNLVDREGGVRDEFFSLRDSSGRLIHRFLDVASTIDGAYLADSRRGSELAPDTLVKVPLPLMSLRLGTPACLDRDGMPVYEVIPYIVVALPLRRARGLERNWAAAAERERANLVAQALDDWRPGSARRIDEEKM